MLPPAVPFARHKVAWADLIVVPSRYFRYESARWVLRDAHEGVIAELAVPQERPFSFLKTMSDAVTHLNVQFGIDATAPAGTDWRGPRPTVTTLGEGVITEARRYCAEPWTE